MLEKLSRVVPGELPVITNMGDSIVAAAAKISPAEISNFELQSGDTGASIPTDQIANLIGDDSAVNVLVRYKMHSVHALVMYQCICSP